MKGDWHRYNLKRRVAQLPPISEQTFNEKVNVLGNGTTSESPESARDGKNKTLTKKEMRRLEKEKLLAKKKKLLEIAKENMLKNMQTTESQSEAQTDVPAQTASADVPTQTASTETLDTELNKLHIADNKDTVLESKQEDTELSEEQLAEQLMEEKLKNKVDFLPEQCLFCTKRTVFPSFEANIEHMYAHHGFYIPEQKYLVDMRGLVKYMGEKIGIGNLCLCCSYQGRSVQAVQSHMLMKRHCKIPYESEQEKLEISEFYDFSSTYNAFGNNTEKKENLEEQTLEENDGEWEDISEEDDTEDYEIIEESQSSSKEGKGKGEDEEDEEEIPEEYLYNDGYNLHLPTGVKVGHRSLQRYYKQVTKPERVLTEGQGTVVAAETRHFVALMDKHEINSTKRVWQSQIKDRKRDDKRRAKFINAKEHYRDQLLQ